MEKLECSYTASRNVNGVATVEKSGSSSKGKTELPYNPAIPLLNIYPRKKKNNICPYKDIYMDIHSSFIHNSQNLGTTKMSFDRWSNKLWYIHTMEYYTAIRVKVKVKSCPALCDPMDCSLPGSSLHGILQARVLEWVAISFSRGSSQSRDRTWVSCIPGRRFNLWATREAQL